MDTLFRFIFKTLLEELTLVPKMSGVGFRAMWIFKALFRLSALEGPHSRTVLTPGGS